MKNRQTEIIRRTQETNIAVTLLLEGSGQSTIDSGVPFFDHMLAQTTRHGHFDLSLKATGDLQIDAHHTIEDCGIAIGCALTDCLGDKAGIRRFGHAYAPLDEALARVVIDLSGRPSLSYQASSLPAHIGGIDADLFREFFQALVNHAQITLHIDLLRGTNGHHQIESIFKSFGLALSAAVTRHIGTDIPSTKGVL